jgi:hypothetical protein
MTRLPIPELTIPFPVKFRRAHADVECEGVSPVSDGCGLPVDFSREGHMVRGRATWWVVVFGVIFPALPVAAKDGPRRWSDEWYEQRAVDPPGTRQVFKYGKLWPPYPRPVGPKQTFWHSYHTAKYWPYPYNCEDRAFAVGIIQQQAGKGWAIATTLHDYHFDSETNRLNSAGEAHLRWILTEAPTPYRTAFVASGVSPQVGEFRLAQVQEMARQITGSDGCPILLRSDSFLARPAIEIDTLRRLELQAQPQPRLFVIGASGATGSASGPSSAQAGGTSGQPQTTGR